MENEGYKIIKHYENKMWFIDSPVVFEAGNLLHDTLSNRMVFQAKFSNVSSNIINALFFNIICFDVTNKRLGMLEEFQYLDQIVEKGGFFGSNTPVVLPFENTRNVKMVVLKVVFEGGEVWENNSGIELKALPQQEKLNKILHPEIYSQLLREYQKQKDYKNNPAEYFPLETKDYWLCACGQFNYNLNLECSNCNYKKDFIFYITRMDTLKPLLEQYYAEQEQKKQEQARKKEIEAEQQASQQRMNDKLKLEKERIKKKKNRKIKKWSLVTISSLISVVFLLVLNVIYIQPALKYKNGIRAFESGQYNEAVSSFEKIPQYKDSADMIKKSYYEQGNKDLLNNDYLLAIASFQNIREYKDSSQIITKINNACQVLAASDLTSLAIKNDGTVIAVGDNRYGQCDVNSWQNIVAISSTGFHSVGLKSDGTVVAVGDNRDGQCNVSSWQNIIAVSAGGTTTYGLKSNGTVVAVGGNYWGQCNISNWQNIIAISAGIGHIVGLKDNGTVVAVGYNREGQCNLKGWNDIISIDAGGSNTVGLKSDCTIEAAGNFNKYDFNRWGNIIAISTSEWTVVGLKADGTVMGIVSYEPENWGQCNFTNWQDIISIFAGDQHTLGLKADGTVVGVGNNSLDRLNIINWKNIFPMEIKH